MDFGSPHVDVVVTSTLERAQVEGANKQVDKSIGVTPAKSPLSTFWNTAEAQFLDSHEVVSHLTEFLW